MKYTAHVIISGKVQGVWFRANTKNKADQLGIMGWVKNTPDGNVEAFFEGEKDRVDDIIEWCHHGPSQAQVRNVKCERRQITSNKFKKFFIKY